MGFVGVCFLKRLQTGQGAHWEKCGGGFLPERAECGEQYCETLPTPTVGPSGATSIHQSWPGVGQRVQQLPFETKLIKNQLAELGAEGVFTVGSWLLPEGVNRPHHL